MVEIQVLDKPEAQRSALKNDALEVASLLLHVVVFLLLARAQLWDKLGIWALVAVNTQV